MSPPYLINLALLILLALLPATLRADQKEQKAVMFSIPKSGTHLLVKILGLMTERPVEWAASSVVANPSISAGKLDSSNPAIIFHHLFTSFDFIKKDRSGRYKKIIMIRDPRDALISQIKWMDHLQGWYVPDEYILEFNRLSFDQQLNEVILFPEAFYSIPFFIKKALEWMEDPEVLVCRFEELVGPAGGGDAQVQRDALHRLASHLNYPLSEEKLDQVISRMFGDTNTFRKGQIGLWREQFTPAHKELLKTHWGDLLIRLGYERDNLW